ncbi:hypothetical protein LSUB1_G002330, partial [Lachnellula subtilissima]
TIGFTPKTYKEETKGRGTEPKKRWLNFVLDSLNRKWHNNTFSKLTKRQKDLENFCLYINFKSTQLLNDTVTKLLLTRKHDTHR